MQDESSPPEGGDVFGNANALPKGTRLFEFEIERVLGEGGFAIVYLAFDHSLHRRVALKEYLPAEFAFRQDEHSIILRSVQYQNTFEAGRKSFVQEARFLAQFEHPSLVKVHRVFESNGTAYMVQGYYPGESMSAMIKAGRRFDSDTALRPVVASLLRAVELLHARQCLHRDIAPDNIILQPNGVPVLLDFGAARRIIGDMTQALTAVLKPSYAPIEQYTEDGGLAQGPWTDVYALAATLRAAITGKPPPSSVGRTIKDGLVKLADDPPPGFDLAFLRGVDAGLAILPADRPQSIAAFREALGIPEEEADGDAPAGVVRAPPPVRAPDAPAAPMPGIAPPTIPRSQAGVPPPPIAMDDITLPGAQGPSPPVTPAPEPATVSPSKAGIAPPRAQPAARSHAPASVPAPAPRRRLKRGDVMLIVIGASAVLLMLLVPFAADWIWPSPPTLPARADRPPPAPSTAPPPPPAPSRSASPPAAPAPTPSPPVTTAAAPSAAAAVPKPTPGPAAAPAPPTKESKEPRESTAPALAAPAPAPERAPGPPPATSAARSQPPVPELAAPPRQEPPRPAATASLIPPPSPSPAPREDARPPAAAPAQQAAAAPAPSAPKPRRSLVRVAGEPPVYPRDAIRTGIESGRVVALVTVDERGGVADIAILTSEPPRVFDRAARTALEAWKFKPEGERYQGEVELRFNLKP